MKKSSSIAHVEGPNLKLRLIQPEDAIFVHGLRCNTSSNRYLSKVSGPVEEQQKWIESYKTRERSGQELYYVIQRKGGTPCGLVRLYDIQADSFTWGSWILNEHKPRKAALESAVLSFGIGFELLKCKVANVFVRLENKHATAFYKRFGMTETHRTNQEIVFVYTRTRFISDKNAHLSIIAQEQHDA